MYYVKKHHVRLPDRVVQWAAEHRPTFVPTVNFNYPEGGVTKSFDVPIGNAGVMEVDSDWWREQHPTWGRRRQNSQW